MNLPSAPRPTRGRRVVEPERPSSAVQHLTRAGRWIVFMDFDCNARVVPCD